MTDQNLKSQDDHLCESQIEGTQVFRGKLLDVRLDRVRLPDGHEATREYVVHQGAAVVIPVLDNGELVFERQFRYPLGKVLIEFPAGKIDPGEDALTTAKRELLEETGYTAHRYTHITDIHNALAYCDEVIHFYIAEDLHDSGQQKLDDNEFVQVMRVPLVELMNWIRQGWVPDVKTQLGAFWLQDYLSKKEV